MMFSKQNPQTVATLTFKKRGEEIPHGSVCHPGIRVMISDPRRSRGGSSFSTWGRLKVWGHVRTASAIFLSPVISVTQKIQSFGFLLMEIAAECGQKTLNR